MFRFPKPLLSVYGCNLGDASNFCLTNRKYKCFNKTSLPLHFYPILMHHDWSLTSQYLLTSVLTYPRQPWSLFCWILLRICWSITASQVILRSGTIPWKITTSNVIQISTINTALFNKTSAQRCTQWCHSIRIFLKEADQSYLGTCNDYCKIYEKHKSCNIFNGRSWYGV